MISRQAIVVAVGHRQDKGPADNVLGAKSIRPKVQLLALDITKVLAEEFEQLDRAYNISQTDSRHLCTCVRIVCSFVRVFR